MKRKLSSIWRMALAAVLVFSLGMVMAAPTETQAVTGLVVTIDSPSPGDRLHVSQTFNVVTTVQNMGTEPVTGSATISWGPPGGAELIPGESDLTKSFGTLSPGAINDVQWTLHCLAPGPLVITVSADGAVASVEVLQVAQEELQVTLDSPEDGTILGVSDPSNFTVTGTVSNTGFFPIDDVVATLATDTSVDVTGEAVGTGDGSQTQWRLYYWPIEPASETIYLDAVGQLDNGTVYNLNDDNGYLTFVNPPGSGVAITADYTGASAVSLVSPIVPTIPLGTLNPGDVVPVEWTLHCDGRGLVDISISASGMGSATNNPVEATSPTVQVFQKYLVVKITTPVDGSTINISQEYVVEATITNYHPETLTQVQAWVEWAPGPGAILLTPPAYLQYLDPILSGDTVIVPFWHFHCNDEGSLDFTVTARGITAFSLLTLENYDEVTIIQQEPPVPPDPAELEAEITTPQTSDCFGIYEEFTVTADITNDGGATATGVTATLSIISGNAIILDAETKTLNDLAGGGGQDSASWTLKCTGPGDVIIRVTPAGTDAYYGGAITTLTHDEVTIHQLPLEVVITNPTQDPIPTYSESQTFSVEADIINHSIHDVFNNVTVTLHWSGPANLLAGESATKTIPEILKGQTQQVAWTVHCNGSGSVTFWVELETDWDEVPQSTLSQEVTVHQEYATDLEVTILSPEDENFDTFVATSQEFAVTARVENTGEADSTNTTVTIVSVNPNKFEVVSPPEATINLGTLAGYDEVIVTWTLHALTGAIDGARIRVKAEGTDENSNDRKFASAGVWVKVYRAAHLEVDITAYPEVDVPVSTVFPVTATITNTGKADAWEVSAILDIFPEGSAKVAAGDVGYTQYIGTIPGHGSEDNVRTVTWDIHCKLPSESTITITVTGFDEYGITIHQQKTRYEGDLYTDEWVTFNGEIEGWADIDGWVDGHIIGDTRIDGYVEGHVKVTTGGFIDGEINLDDAVIYVDGFFDGSVDGEFTGHIKGDFDGWLDGWFSGMIDGMTFDQYWNGPVPDLYVDGYFDGLLDGYWWDDDFDPATPDVWKDADFEGDIDGHFVGDAVGWFTGNLLGTVDVQGAILHGSADLFFDGSVSAGFFDGHFEGDFVGTVDAWVEGYLDGVFLQMYYVGPFAGFWDGNIEGTYIGSVDGSFTGTLNQVFFTGYIYGGTVYVQGQAIASDIHIDATVRADVIGYVHIVATFDGSMNTYTNTYVNGVLWEFTKTMNPGAPIPERFIEPDGVTVRQVERPTEADLEVTKEVVGESTVTVGQDVTFTITVTNNGPADATGVVVADVLPPGLNYAGGGPPSQGWYYIAQGFWSVGDLAYDASATLTIVATVNAVGEIHNMATVDFADQHDPTTTNNAAMVTITGLAAAPIDDVELAMGYNLMSLPLIPVTPAIGVMLAGLNVNAAITYTTGGEWLSYWPANPGQSDLDNMVDGQGYWIDMNAAGTLDFPGWPLVAETDPPSLPPSYDVVSGWNLIGFKSIVPKPAEEYLAAIVGKYVIIYGFDDGSFFIVGTPGHEFLQPGLGYWLAIVAGESGTIFP